MNNNELEELQELFRKAGTQTQKLTAPLLNNAIFMSKGLDELMTKIEQSGWTTGNAPSGEAKAYNQLIGSFNATIKNLYGILNDKMPDTNTKPTNDIVAKIRGGR